MRLTSSSDPSSFHVGEDLIQKEGIWHIPLISMGAYPKYSGLYGQFLCDRLVTEQLSSRCKRHFQSPPSPHCIGFNVSSIYVGQHTVSIEVIILRIDDMVWGCVKD
jgi:hypothetical protein